MTRKALRNNRTTAGLLPAGRSGSVDPMVARVVSKLLANRRGAVTVEYAMLIGFVGISGAAALLTFGPAIASTYEHTRGTLMLPIP